MLSGTYFTQTGSTLTDDPEWLCPIPLLHIVCFWIIISVILVLLFLEQPRVTPHYNLFSPLTLQSDVVSRTFSRSKSCFVLRIGFLRGKVVPERFQITKINYMDILIRACLACEMLHDSIWTKLQGRSFIRSEPRNMMEWSLHWYCTILLQERDGFHVAIISCQI